MKETLTSTLTDGCTGMDGRQVGALAHRLIADLLRGGKINPEPEYLLAAAARHPATRGAIQYQQAARQRLASSAAVYFRFFQPLPGWDLIGVEHRAGKCRFDLVFRTADGRIRVDELKAGHLNDAAVRALRDNQIDRYVTAGKSEWGEHFDGVRVCILTRPRASFIARPDGSCEEAI